MYNIEGIAINPISIIVGHWLIYIIFLSIIVTLVLKSNSIANLVKATEVTKQKIGKGIRTFALILLALSAVEIIYFYIDTVGYFSNKKEYPNYHLCKIKKITIHKGILITEMLFSCENDKTFKIDNWGFNLLSWSEISYMLTSYKHKLIYSKVFDDSENAFCKFTILPKTGIIINLQPINSQNTNKNIP